MKIYTFYTDSHKQLLDDFFLPSFEKTNKNMELIVTKFDQQCKSGIYMSDGWMKSMHDKVDLIIRGIEENWNSFFVHADCDIQFFGDIKEDLLNQIEDNDLAGTDDDPFNQNSEISCGFFICKGNEKTLSLFKEVKRIMGGNLHDQHAFNHIKNNYISSKKLNYKHYNVSHSNGGRIWYPGIQLNPFNTNILTHHANWIIGVEHKIKNLELIRNIINENNNS
jgi:hypothetical protein